MPSRSGGRSEPARTEREIFGSRIPNCPPPIVIAVCCVGPLALPLIWWRPQTTRAWKIGLTIDILVLSWLLFQSTLKSIETLKEYYGLMDGL